MLKIEPTEEVVAAISKQVEREDRENSLIEDKAKIGKKLNLLFVGMVHFDNDDDHLDMLKAFLTDESVFDVFNNKEKTLPLAFIVLSTKGEVFIVINRKLRDMAIEAYAQQHISPNVLSVRDLWNASIVRGTFAHEVGHYIAKHFNDNRPPLQLSNVDTDDLDPPDEDSVILSSEGFRKVTLALLNNGYFIKEYEADLKAINYCNLTDIINCHLQLSDQSHTLGIRLAHHNLITKHLHSMYTSDVYYTPRGKELRIMIFSDEEMKEIRISD